jgi:hypothetical protein
MPDQPAQTHALIVLTPILPDREGAVRDTLDRLPPGADSALARSGTTHFARWVIINRLMYTGPPQQRDTLRGPYLLFTSHYDGALDAYLDELCALLPAELDAIYRHCVGYPGVRDRQAFTAWLRRDQLDPTFYFSAYAQASLTQVLTALELRERLRAFALETQGLDAVALKEAYRRAFGFGGTQAPDAPVDAPQVLGRAGR